MSKYYNPNKERINKLAYKLYGLNEEEIRIIEDQK